MAYLWDSFVGEGYCRLSASQLLILSYGSRRVSDAFMELAEGFETSLRLQLDSAIASVEQAEATAEKFALQAGFDVDTASQIAMVVREAAVNAAKHGNGWSREKRVEVGFELTERSLTIQVADQGGGLDPEQVEDCLEPANLLRTSGRGIFLMRSIMDEVHFRKLTPGTEITMVKRRIEKEIQA